jgi:ketosteroid isomerase-like protein
MDRVAPWTQAQINIGLALRFWSFFYVHSSLREKGLGGGDQTLFDMLADDVVWIHEGPRHPDVPWYPGEIRGKQALIDMITSEGGAITDLDLEDPVERPLEFVGTGNRVVVLDEERYTIAMTGVTVRNNRNAIVMDFRDGLVSQIRIIANLADYIESHRGVGWSTRSS